VYLALLAGEERPFRPFGLGPERLGKGYRKKGCGRGKEGGGGVAGNNYSQPDLWGGDVTPSVLR